jgi:hypothetical protein
VDYFTLSILQNHKLNNILRMKTFKLLLLTLCCSLTFVSCDKDLELTEKLSPVTPVDLDDNAGTWDMIVMTSPDQIAVPVPTATDDPAYVAELTAIKQEQASLTSKQKDIIEYWSAGGIIRWNQFMRELVARFNLPPAPNALDQYPLPDAENPFADPNFPFANPPYAARAYSYVSVGQYEAMKAAWHYKYLYQRPAPSVVDNDIKRFSPDTDLPAYPSEDAVMSGVTAEMLKALFPAAVKEITLKAAEQRNAARWSGKASVSDISEGLKLGKSIAGLMMARAKDDKMGTAAGSKTIWTQLEEACTAKGERFWKSQEVPARPPMLMNFGKVKAWNLTPEQIIANRPAPPPSTESELMAAEVREVKKYVNEYSRERQAIVHFWADGVGTYTPPGHWNDIATEYIHQANFSEVRTARTYALLNMAMHDAAVICWETKMFYFNPRPSQMNPSIKTVTGLPNFPSYTSGHSTFSGAASVVLSHFFPAAADKFEAMAQEASLSRLYAGIHFRSDITAGLENGRLVGEFTLDYAGTDGAD